MPKIMMQEIYKIETTGPESPEPMESLQKDVCDPLLVDNYRVKFRMAEELVEIGLSKRDAFRILNINCRETK